MKRAWTTRIKTLNMLGDSKRLKAELEKEIITEWGSHQEFLKKALDDVNNKLYPKLQGCDYYELLEVDRDAPTDVIRKVYRKKCMLYHPDRLLSRRQLSDEERKEADDMSKLLNEAMDFLENPEWRRRYDKGEDPQKIQQASLRKRED